MFSRLFFNKARQEASQKFLCRVPTKIPKFFTVAVNADSNEIIGLANGYIIGQNIRDEFIKNNFAKLLLRGIYLLLKFDGTAWGKVFKTLSSSKSESVKKAERRRRRSSLRMRS